MRWSDAVCPACPQELAAMLNIDNDTPYDVKQANLSELTSRMQTLLPGNTQSVLQVGGAGQHGSFSCLPTLPWMNRPQSTPAGVCLS